MGKHRNGTTFKDLYCSSCGHIKPYDWMCGIACHLLGIPNTNKPFRTHWKWCSVELNIGEWQSCTRHPRMGIDKNDDQNVWLQWNCLNSVAVRAHDCCCYCCWLIKFHFDDILIVNCTYKSLDLIPKIGSATKTYENKKIVHNFIKQS